MKRPFGMWLILAALSCVAIGCINESKDSTNKSGPGDPTPSGGSGPSDGTLKSCRFAEVESAIAANKGKVILIDVWARWCPPCVSGFPHFVETANKYRDRGLVCMSVSIDAGQNRYPFDQVQSFLQEKGANFPNFYLSDPAADDEQMDKAFGQIQSIPYKVLIGRDGRKVWDFARGRLSDAQLDKKIVAELDK